MARKHKNSTNQSLPDRWLTIEASEDSILNAHGIVEGRSPFEFNLGYISSDGVGSHGKAWFHSERELLEYITVVEPFIHNQECDDEYHELRSKIQQICEANHWQVSDKLLASLNECFPHNQQIVWWGSFQAEFSKGFSGEFSWVLSDCSKFWPKFWRPDVKIV